MSFRTPNIGLHKLTLLDYYFHLLHGLSVSLSSTTSMQIASNTHVQRTVAVAAGELAAALAYGHAHRIAAQARSGSFLTDSK